MRPSSSRVSSSASSSPSSNPSSLSSSLVDFPLHFDMNRSQLRESMSKAGLPLSSQTAERDVFRSMVIVSYTRASKRQQIEIAEFAYPAHLVLDSRNCSHIRVPETDSGDDQKSKSTNWRIDDMLLLTVNELVSQLQEVDPQLILNEGFTSERLGLTGWDSSEGDEQVEDGSAVEPDEYGNTRLKHGPAEIRSMECVGLCSVHHFRRNDDPVVKRQKKDQADSNERIKSAQEMIGSPRILPISESCLLNALYPRRWPDTASSHANCRSDRQYVLIAAGCDANLYEKTLSGGSGLPSMASLIFIEYQGNEYAIESLNRVFETWQEKHPYSGLYMQFVKANSGFLLLPEANVKKYADDEMESFDNQQLARLSDYGMEISLPFDWNTQKPEHVATPLRINGQLAIFDEKQVCNLHVLYQLVLEAGITNYNREWPIDPIENDDEEDCYTRDENYEYRREELQQRITNSSFPMPTRKGSKARTNRGSRIPSNALAEKEYGEQYHTILSIPVEFRLYSQTIGVELPVSVI